jgi:nitrite reductase/ring-hydroxylating ferredoxin subunit
MNRREFIQIAATATCAGLCGASCTRNDPSAATAGASEPGAAASAGPLVVGTPADYPRDGPYDRFADEHEVLLIRSGGRLIATSAVCTHKRAILLVKGGQILCPKHGSRFDKDGVPQTGPARSPLDRFAITLSPEGTLVVDRSRVFGPGQWQDPASYVAVGA